MSVTPRDTQAVEAFTPDLSSAVMRRRSEFPAMARNAPFLLAYHPGRWTVLRDEDGKYHCVPQLGALSIIPGVNRVDTRGGRPYKEDAISAWKRRGYTVLEDSAEYLRAVKVPTGVYYMTAWETAHPGDDRTETDTVGYAAWLNKLVERMSKQGIAPTRVALRRLRARYAEDLLTALEQADRSPKMHAKAARLRSSLEAIDEAIERWAPKAAAEAVPVTLDDDNEPVEQDDEPPTTKPARKRTSRAKPATPAKD